MSQRTKVALVGAAGKHRLRDVNYIMLQTASGPRAGFFANRLRKTPNRPANRTEKKAVTQAESPK